ncbi:MAG: hypothetical protein WBB28_01360 [Crinalium sp.]
MPTDPIAVSETQAAKQADVPTTGTTTVRQGNIFGDLISRLSKKPADGGGGVRLAGQIGKINREESPIKGQSIDRKVQPYSTPLQITVLTGDFRGEIFKVGQWLGVTPEEISHKSGADWKTVEGMGIRNSATFEKLSDRTFSVKLSFYDKEEDISCLVENLQWLNASGRAQKNPPLMSLRQGLLRANPVILQTIDTTYKNPHSGDTGFMYAEVQLSFLLIAGPESPHATGGPLSPTPLGDTSFNQSEEERDAKLKTALANDVLIPCLGRNDSEEVSNLIINKKTDDVDSLKKLSPEAFVNLVAGGQVKPSTLVSQSSITGFPELQAKLSNDLSLLIATYEPGVAKTIYGATLAAYLRGDEPINSLPDKNPNLRAIAPRIKQDYEIIRQAMLTQDFSQVIDRTKNPTTGERLKAVASCGLQMKQIKSSYEPPKTL